LPENFSERMRGLLHEEWPELLASWERQPYQGLRVNTMKISAAEFTKRSPFQLEPVPWAAEGFYFNPEDRPAKHPYYYAGLYYLQEPSAMAPAACLGVEPGQKVLDLCAAPGGKSTQILDRLRGQGFLLSNEINTARAKALTWNLERWGAVNAVITNEDPRRLSARFAAFFDRILVDAPCSGEGMFSRDKRACNAWTAYSHETCTVLQKEILAEAAKMLKPGGAMLYSTCTFSPEENEGVIDAFLEKQGEFRLAELPLGPGWAEGRPDWLTHAAPNRELAKTRRLWPHKVKGEGHFLALLEKRAAAEHETQFGASEKNRSGEGPVGEKDLAPLAEFFRENLTQPPAGPFCRYGDYVYQIPQGLPSLAGLRILRWGWFMGSIKNSRFEPSQALALGLDKDAANRSASFEPGAAEVRRYLKGETLLAEGPKGWTLVCVEEFPLGWAKQGEGTLKNYYPPSWRITEG